MTAAFEAALKMPFHESRACDGLSGHREANGESTGRIRSNADRCEVGFAPPSGEVRNKKLIVLREMSTSELTAVRSFYRDVGYGGRARSSDRVVSALDGVGIVAALRLCEEESCLVMRGVYVAADRRSQGIGTSLVRFAEQWFHARDIWCLPYAHLVPFYGRFGFSQVSENEAPEFLRARLWRA